jgi:tRNA-dihydrouridine synthase C
MQSILPKDSFGCPYLVLAPMEGVADQFFRRAILSIGGFNEATLEFMRVPSNAHVQSLAKKYAPYTIQSIIFTPQIMGKDPNLMAQMALELEKKGAPKIDINCGCPADKVTRRGAGATLLKNPELLYTICSNIKKAVKIPVSAKMRSGYHDESLFEDNLFALQESGIDYLTIHPRTKVQGYRLRANWDLIKKAKSILKIPIVGNGDIKTIKDVQNILSLTQCDAIMIGRGALIDPFIFVKIQSWYQQKEYIPNWQDMQQFLTIYFSEISALRTKTKINKLKQLFSMLMQAKPNLEKYRKEVLISPLKDPFIFFEYALNLFKKGWEENLI